MTSSLTAAFSVGDIVVPNVDNGWPARTRGTRLVVTKVPTRRNEKNYVATPCDFDGVALPGARGFRGPATSFIAEADAAAATTVTAAPNPPVASLVRPKPGTSIPEGVYVVIGETDAQRVRIMLLGGDNGRYYRCPSTNLDVIDAAAATRALATI